MNPATDAQGLRSTLEEVIRTPTAIVCVVRVLWEKGGLVGVDGGELRSAAREVGASR